MYCRDFERYGFDFNGSNAIDVYTNPSLSAQNSAVYFEINPQATAVGNILLGSFSTTVPNFEIYISPTLLSIEFRTTSVSFTTTVTIPRANINDNEINRVCILMNDQTDDINMAVFLNGVYVGADYVSWGASLSYSINATGQPDFPIGHDASDFVLSNLAFYNNTLTDIEAKNITSGFFDSTNSDIVFLESFNQTTQGAITGTEQYNIIEEDKTCYNGELFNKKDTKSFTATNSYEWIVNDFVYGGDFELTINNVDAKTVSIAEYDTIQNRFFTTSYETYTEPTKVFNLKGNEARRILITIESDSDFSEITYNFEHVADILENADTTNAGAIINDTFVQYEKYKFENKNLVVRIEKQDKEKFNTMVENKIYFNDVEYIVNNSSFRELDIENYSFSLSLSRLL